MKKFTNVKTKVVYNNIKKVKIQKNVVFIILVCQFFMILKKVGHVVMLLFILGMNFNKSKVVQKESMNLKVRKKIMINQIFINLILIEDNMFKIRNQCQS